MQQLRKLRISGEFLKRAPILLAGFRLELGANGGQIHRSIVQLRISGRIVVLVLFVLAHTVH